MRDHRVIVAPTIGSPVVVSVSVVDSVAECP
jgi:hypothetical protein